MSVEKYITLSVLRSKRDQMRGFAEAEKFLRDRNDVYLLSLDSFMESVNEKRINFEYECLEVKINPDFDW
jgi:hypothetical protein